MKMMMKECQAPPCHNIFSSRYIQQKYCCPQCKGRAARVRMKEKAYAMFEKELGNKLERWVKVWINSSTNAMRELAGLKVYKGSK